MDKQNSCTVSTILGSSWITLSYTAGAIIRLVERIYESDHSASIELRICLLWRNKMPPMI